MKKLSRATVPSGSGTQDTWFVNATVVHPSATNNDTVESRLGKANRHPFLLYMQRRGRNPLDKDVQIRNSRFRFWRTTSLGLNLLSVDLCAHMRLPKTCRVPRHRPQFYDLSLFQLPSDEAFAVPPRCPKGAGARDGPYRPTPSQDPATERRLCCREEGDDQKELQLRIGDNFRLTAGQP